MECRRNPVQQGGELRLGVSTRDGDREPEQRETVRAVAEVDSQQPVEAARQEPGAGQHDDGQSDLYRNEPSPQVLARPGLAPRPRVDPEWGGEICLGSGERGEHPHQHDREECHTDSRRERCVRQANEIASRKSGGLQYQQDAEQRHRHEETERASADGERTGLDQQKTGDVAGRGAERTADRKLMRPRRHAQQDQAAHVDARQHEQQRYRCREHLEDWSHIPEDSLRERADPGSSHHLPVAGVLRPVHLPHGREELGPRRPSRGSRGEAG